MYQFIESMCWEKGSYQLLGLHQQRMDRTFHQFFQARAPRLSEILPKPDATGKTKVRVVYSEKIQSIETIPYEIKRPDTLKLIHVKGMDYSFKFLNREALESLKSHNQEVIIVKNGKVTDASYANLAFFDGQSWFTPKTYLLNGVKRQHLISQGILQEVDMKAKDILNFDKVSLVNAMLDLEDLVFALSEIEQ